MNRKNQHNFEVEVHVPNNPDVLYSPFGVSEELVKYLNRGISHTGFNTLRGYRDITFIAESAEDAVELQIRSEQFLKSRGLPNVGDAMGGFAYAEIHDHEP